MLLPDQVKILCCTLGVTPDEAEKYAKMNNVLAKARAVEDEMIQRFKEFGGVLTLVDDEIIAQAEQTMSAAVADQFLEYGDYTETGEPKPDDLEEPEPES